MLEVNDKNYVIILIFLTSLYNILSLIYYKNATLRNIYTIFKRSCISILFLYLNTEQSFWTCIFIAIIKYYILLQYDLNL